jgi:hypothetical protein
MNNLSHHPVDDMIQFLGTGWKLVPSRSEVDIYQEQFLFITHLAKHHMKIRLLTTHTPHVALIYLT